MAEKTRTIKCKEILSSTGCDKEFKFQRFDSAFEQILEHAKSEHDLLSFWKETDETVKTWKDQAKPIWDKKSEDYN